VGGSGSGRGGRGRECERRLCRTYGVAVMTGTVGERLAVYRIPWHTIDAILPM
jgi:hypothetical protein